MRCQEETEQDLGEQARCQGELEDIVPDTQTRDSCIRAQDWALGVVSEEDSAEAWASAGAADGEEAVTAHSWPIHR